MYLPLQDIEAAKLNIDDPEHLRIHSLETFGTHDGPGVRMVVFAQGCQFRCVYCQNPDTIDVRAGTLVEIKELVERAIKQRPYFGKTGGVTVSGGEPLLQRTKLLHLFTQLKKEKIHTCIDTNGRLVNDEVKRLLEVTDLVLLDVKHIDDTLHHKLTGVSNKSTLELAEYCESIGKPVWLRYVLLPGWTDQHDHLEAWAKHFSHYKHVERVEIIPFHQLGQHKWEAMRLQYHLADVHAPSESARLEALSIFSKYLNNVILK